VTSSFLRKVVFAVAIWLIADKPPPALAGGDLSSQEANKVLPLTQFLAAIRAAHYSQYAARAGSTVASKDAFAEMQAYILQRYKPIDVDRVKYYVIDAGGSVFDCLPQAASTSPPATPPSPPGAEVSRDRLAQQNLITSCPPGTFPFQRITLETLVKFPHLRNFFQK
jgi:hypothetical protein